MSGTVITILWIYLIGVFFSIGLMMYADRLGKFELNVDLDEIEITTKIGQIVLVALLWPIVVCFMRIKRK